MYKKHVGHLLSGLARFNGLRIAPQKRVRGSFYFACPPLTLSSYMQVSSPCKSMETNKIII